MRDVFENFRIIRYIRDAFSGRVVSFVVNSKSGRKLNEIAPLWSSVELVDIVPKIRVFYSNEVQTKFEKKFGRVGSGDQNSGAVCSLMILKNNYTKPFRVCGFRS